MPTCPLHLITAPEAGSGKSYLADLVSLIATGEQAAVIATAPSAEETEKRLIGAALAGHPIITLDNCHAALAGDFLCQLTERPLLQLRALGSSDKIRVTNTYTTLATGNNAAVADDMVRRTISCRLDANAERPENREFRQNPVVMICQARGKYVAACLTIGRAYLTAGKPRPLPSLPSYEAWSGVVRSALVWLGLPDPVASMESLRGTDPVRQQRAAVFSAWRFELPAGRHQVADVIDFVSTRPGLRAALLEVAASRDGRDEISPRRLGKWLARNENTISGQYKLTVDRRDPSRLRWGVEAIS
jgi:putative DNA primase/helicase